MPSTWNVREPTAPPPPSLPPPTPTAYRRHSQVVSRSLSSMSAMVDEFPDTPQAIEFTPIAEGVKTSTLQNGVTVVSQQTGKATATVGLSVAAGSRFEGPAAAGSALLLKVRPALAPLRCTRRFAVCLAHPRCSHPHAAPPQCPPIPLHPRTWRSPPPTRARTSSSRATSRLPALPPMSPRAASRSSTPLRAR